MKKVVIVCLIYLTFILGYMGVAIATEKAITGVIKLQPGKTKKFLADNNETLNSILIGNGTKLKKSKKIKLYGSDDDQSDTRVRLYGFDTSNNQVGTYAVSITIPIMFSPSSLTEKFVSESSIGGAGIAYRDNYAGGVRFKSFVNNSMSLGFCNNAQTICDAGFFTDSGVVITPPNKNMTQTYKGRILRTVMSTSKTANVTGRFKLKVHDAAYNEFDR